MAEYNVRPNEPLTVQFSPLSIVMAAHFVHWDMPVGPDEAGWTYVGDGIVHELKPVLGVFLRHDVNEIGQVVGARQEFAIQLEDSQELCTPAEYLAYGGSCTALVGIYPYKIKHEPTTEEIEAAVSVGRRFQAERARRASAGPPHVRSA